MAVLLDVYQTTLGAGTVTGHAALPNGATLPAGITRVNGNVFGSTLAGFEKFNMPIGSAVFEVNCSAATSLVSDTLDVYLQYTLDGAANWQDFAHFAQILGNGGLTHSYLQYCTYQTTTGATVTASDGALAAGTIVKGPIGSLWRVKLVQAGASAQFTVAVYVGGVSR